MWEIAVAVFIGLGTVAVVLHNGLKHMLNEEKLTQIAGTAFESILDTSLNDTELQKKIYSLGVLAGSGAKQGIGIGNTGGGKFKMSNLIAIGAAKFLGLDLGGMMGGGQAQPQQQTPPQDSNIPTG